MPEFKDSKTLPFSGRQLYELVTDVKAYPEFLPWCVATRVHSGSDTKMVADLVIGFAVFRERFTSENTLDAAGLEIRTRLVKGPFRHLTSHWKFTDRSDGQGVDVEFGVDFEFRSKLLSRAIEPVFFSAQRKLIAAFEKRAHDLYGPLSPVPSASALSVSGKGS